MTPILTGFLQGILFARASRRIPAGPAAPEGGAAPRAALATPSSRKDLRPGVGGESRDDDMSVYNIYTIILYMVGNEWRKWAKKAAEEGPIPQATLARVLLACILLD